MCAYGPSVPLYVATRAYVHTHFCTSVLTHPHEHTRMHINGFFFGPFVIDSKSSYDKKTVILAIGCFTEFSPQTLSKFYHSPHFREMWLREID